MESDYAVLLLQLQRHSLDRVKRGLSFSPTVQHEVVD